jgi:CheY-like chemotaxis protein
MSDTAKTVLIVEDAEDILFLLKMFLEREGYTVLEATDGRAAVEMAKQKVPDVILIDVSLPALDGLSALRSIKATEGVSHIPVIVVSAYENVERRAMQMGSCGFIPKPIDVDRLRTALRQLFV